MTVFRVPKIFANVFTYILNVHHTPLPYKYKSLPRGKPEFAVIFAIDADDTRQIILPRDIFMVNYWRDNRSKQIVRSQGCCLKSCRTRQNFFLLLTVVSKKRSLCYVHLLLSLTLTVPGGCYFQHPPIEIQRHFFIQR